MTEAHDFSPPVDSDPEPVTEPLHLTVVPDPEPRDWFQRGIYEAVDEVTPLNQAELQAIMRTGGVSEHLVTTVILRCAGENDAEMTPFKELEAAHALLVKETASIPHGKDPKELEAAERRKDRRVAAARVRVEDTFVPAEPYLSVHTKVKPFVKKYESRYVQGVMSRSQMIQEIYDPTEDLEHPGLEAIANTRPVIGDRAIPAERVLRLILIDCGLGDPVQSTTDGI